MECAGKGSGSRCLGLSRKRCGGCGAVAYCSTSHQISHWKQHRHECERFQQQMKHLDLLNDFPFTFSQEATTQISEKRESRCSFLSRRGIHRVGMWICECSCGASISPSDYSRQSSSTSERFAGQNNNSVRGFEVIDQAKADILAVAARDASEYVGGPCWTVKLGRRDSTSAASASLASSQLPSFTDDLKMLIDGFKAKGLSERDIVALSGLLNKRNCPATPPNGDANLAPLDLVTPKSFDNNYFKNLLQKKGLLQSDQVLLSGGSTDSIVTEYSKSPSTFSSDFAAAMVRMGDIEPLTGSAGIIRRVCNVVN
ncbi:hypothetical protein PTKIN_Ptkin17bG0122000 [Pterospermum kingtungense]